jgi:hypothetical protein
LRIGKIGIMELNESNSTTFHLSSEKSKVPLPPQKV